jgi:GT2 family glycosyltransferase
MAFEPPYRDASDVDADSLLARLGSAPPVVTVVIPVYNATQDVETCIASVLRHAGPGMEVVVVDDASPDPSTIALLDRLAADGVVRLVRHERNHGFTRTANDGITAAGSNDVILLNSDTEVGPMWWQRLRWVAYGRDRVATVSAVSNNAGRVSVPVINEYNDWHPDLPWDDHARLLAQEMYVWEQEWPLAAGFCVYLTREAIDAVGALDDEAFPRGYGEEIDFAQRARGAGFANLLAPHVLVRHARSKSFGDDERRRLVKLSMPILAQRYPRRLDEIADWMTSTGNHLIRIVASRLSATAPVPVPQPRVATATAEPGADSGALRITMRIPNGVSHPLAERSVSQDSLAHAISTLAVAGGIESVEVSSTVPGPTAQQLAALTRTLGLPINREAVPVSD